LESWVFLYFLKTILVEVASPTPHTARGLFAIDQDMSELLTV
jgi:hypothetical protein